MLEISEKIKSDSMVLFVGAGVSASIGVPTFRQLIEHIAGELGYNPQIFFSYGDYHSLAQYYINEHGGIGKLRSWMDREWHVKLNDVDTSSLYDAIVRLGIKTVYTTNYDNFLERAHDSKAIKYSKVVKLDDMPRSHGEEIQIIKYHGDFSDDSSIVLNESTYYERMDWESPLDIKLHSDLLSKSVLFIGYSLRDMNMRYLLYKIHKMRVRHSAKKHRSYVYFGSPNPIQSSVLGEWGVEVINGRDVDQSASLEKFLRSLI